MADNEITLAMIMDHLRGMELRLITRMDLMEERLTRLEHRVEWIYKRLTAQIDAIDQRLDAIEIEFLPKRVSRIEKHLNLAV